MIGESCRGRNLDRGRTRAYPVCDRIGVLRRTGASSEDGGTLHSATRDRSFWSRSPCRPRLPLVVTLRTPTTRV